MIAIPRRVVLHGLTFPACVVGVEEEATQVLRINPMSCDCTKKIAPCIAIGADKSFEFRAPTDTDFDLASEITFKVWTSVNGTALITKTMTGGDIIVVNDYSFTLSVTDTESAALTAGSKHCAAWIDTADGKVHPLGAGPFIVRNIGDLS